MLKRIIALLLIATPLMAGDYWVHPSGYFPHTDGVFSRTSYVAPVADPDLYWEYLMNDGTLADTGTNGWDGINIGSTFIPAINGLKGYWQLTAANTNSIVVAAGNTYFNGTSNSTIDLMLRIDTDVQYDGIFRWIASGGVAGFTLINTKGFRGWGVPTISAPSGSYRIGEWVNLTIASSYTASGGAGGTNACYINGTLVTIGTSVAGDITFDQTGTGYLGRDVPAQSDSRHLNGAFSIARHYKVYQGPNWVYTNSLNNLVLQGVSSAYLAGDLTAHTNTKVVVMCQEVYQDGKTNTLVISGSAPTLTGVGTSFGMGKGNGGGNYEAIIETNYTAQMFWAGSEITSLTNYADIGGIQYVDGVPQAFVNSFYFINGASNCFWKSDPTTFYDGYIGAILLGNYTAQDATNFYTETQSIYQP